MGKVSKYITKDETFVLKGFAILIMLFLHLFLNINRVNELDNLILIKDIPLSYWLTRFTCICVSLYMFLSGYGLYIVFKRKTPMHNLKRIGFLYLNVLLVAIVFLPLSFFFPSLGWNFDALTVFYNLSGFYPYNAEWWFLFPWALVCLVSRYILFFLDSHKTWLVLLISCILYLGVRLFIHQYGEGRLVVPPMRWLHELGQFFVLSFSFLLGASCAKHGILTYVQQLAKDSKFVSLCSVILFLLIVYIRIFYIPIGLFEPFIAVMFCCVIVMNNRFRWLDKILIGLGRESTNMWLIHTFFCYYYFHDFIYSFRFPILIYLTLIIVSYVSARIMTFLYQPMKGWLTSKLF